MLYFNDTSQKYNKKAVLSQGETRDAAVNFDRPTYRILQSVDNGTFVYDKHGKLVDEEHMEQKPAQNTLNHV